MSAMKQGSVSTLICEFLNWHEASKRVPNGSNSLLAGTEIFSAEQLLNLTKVKPFKMTTALSQHLYDSTNSVYKENYKVVKVLTKLQICIQCACFMSCLLHTRFGPPLSSSRNESSSSSRGANILSSSLQLCQRSTEWTDCGDSC